MEYCMGSGTYGEDFELELYDEVCGYCQLCGGLVGREISGMLLDHKQVTHIHRENGWTQWKGAIYSDPFSDDPKLITLDLDRGENKHMQHAVTTEAERSSGEIDISVLHTVWLTESFGWYDVFVDDNCALGYHC